MPIISNLPKIKKQKTLTIAAGFLLSLGLVNTTKALDTTNTTIGSELIGADINGHAPFMASVSGELMTEAYNESEERVYYPWVLQDDLTTRGPTIGSIAYVPDIFCQILPQDLALAKNSNELIDFSHSFDFMDVDQDPCAKDKIEGIKVTWYMLDNVTDWNEELTWEALNPVVIPEEYVIKAGSEAAKKYKKNIVMPLI